MQIDQKWNGNMFNDNHWLVQTVARAQTMIYTRHFRPHVSQSQLSKQLK